MSGFIRHHITGFSWLNISVDQNRKKGKSFNDFKAVLRKSEGIAHKEWTKWIGGNSTRSQIYFPNIFTICIDFPKAKYNMGYKLQALYLIFLGKKLTEFHICYNIYVPVKGSY